jgi:predicted DNA-binding transcriptional regulator YafY
MSESGTRSGRLLAIVLLLQTRGRANAREIAGYLDVSLRTVYRDVDVLTRMGVPIYAETGQYGGYQLVAGYRTSLTGLTAQESLALFLIGLPAPAASLGLDKQARGAEAKLLAALAPAHREQADRLRSRFLVDLPAWYADSEASPLLAKLADAMLSGRKVRIRYRRWEEPREVSRTVEPYGLVVKNGVWYLVAASSPGRSVPRTYRVSNVIELSPADGTFECPADFDLAAYWRDSLTDFDRRRISGMARLRLSPSLTSRLADVGDTSLRHAAANGRLDEDGSLVITIPIESPQWAASQLIRHGPDIEVIDPPEVRAAIVSLAESVLQRHESGRGHAAEKR